MKEAQLVPRAAWLDAEKSREVTVSNDSIAVTCLKQPSTDQARLQADHRAHLILGRIDAKDDFIAVLTEVPHLEAACDGGNFAVMGDDDHRHPFLFIQFSEQIEDLLPALLVQIPRRLIGQNQRRMVDQSPRYRDTLLLAPTESAWPMLQAIPEPHLLQPGARMCSPLLRRDFHRVERESHIFQCGEGGNEMENLKDKPYMFSPPQGELVLVQRADLLSFKRDAP
jgi:hypothetical protein